MRVEEGVGAEAALERDIQLMLQVREGDSASFELLLAKHRSPVVSYLNRMVQNQALAEDLAQEVFFRVYRARASYEPSAKFTTWLYRIATHLALNALRDRRNEARHRSLDEQSEQGPALQVGDGRATQEEWLIEQARARLIRGAVARLPEKQRAAVLMHKYQELDYGQIAAVFGCSVSAVKSLLFRAYESLRNELSPLVSNPKKRSGGGEALSGRGEKVS